jgi:arylsulfatase
MISLARLVKVALIALSFMALSNVEHSASAGPRPNILFIVTDDMGYSDWGSFGGEIRTPNLDQLAKLGVRFTNFYTAPTCSPTRSMLMTGIDHHMVGLGNMGEALQPNQRGKPGYEGYLNDRAVTIAQLLQEDGYATMMSGKWHLGEDMEQDPSRKGFEKSFAILNGGASHFGDEWMLSANYTPIYRENGKRVHLPSDFYSSKFYTQKIIDWLKAKKDERPFFAYLAFTAPHDPLHVPDDWLDRYSGAYDKGYDELREQRFARMRELKIISDYVIAAPRPRFVPGWDKLTPAQRKFSARSMEIYASMIENLDHHVGRLIKMLKEKGLYENTLIVFFSDNGANGWAMDTYPQTDKKWVERNSDNRYENIGRRASRIAVGPGWALASMTPFRMFKGFISEGGIRSPMIVAGPGVKGAGRISHSVTDVRDIVPTILDIAGVKQPKKYRGQVVLPIQGKSMKSHLAGKTGSVHGQKHTIGFEFFGWRGIRAGDLKATWISKPFGKAGWELFDLATDPGETRDLSAKKPAELMRLEKLWDEYAEKVGVVLPEKLLGQK